MRQSSSCTSLQQHAQQPLSTQQRHIVRLHQKIDNYCNTLVLVSCILALLPTDLAYSACLLAIVDTRHVLPVILNKHSTVVLGARVSEVSNALLTDLTETLPHVWNSDCKR